MEKKTTTFKKKTNKKPETPVISKKRKQLNTFNINKYISYSPEGTPVLNAGVIDPTCGYKIYKSNETMTEMPGYKWQISSTIIPGKNGNDIFVKFLIEHMGPMTMVIFTNKNKTFKEPMQRAVSLGEKSTPPIDLSINSEIAKAFLINVANTENCLSVQQRADISQFMLDNQSTPYFWVVYPGMQNMEDIIKNMGHLGVLTSGQITFDEDDTLAAAPERGGKSKRTKGTKRRNKSKKRKTRKYKK
jgi:hypothetical protein